MTFDLNLLEPFGKDVGFGYLDRTVLSPRRFQPQLVLNTESDSMLRALRYELKHSSSFTFSVAFVSSRAIALLKQELLEYEGVGRIITSDYLGFNSPQAFAELLNLSSFGIDVRMHNKSAFHPKGYVFERPDGITAILGSSNLTEAALNTTHEWNLRVSAASDSDLYDQFANLVDQEIFDSSPLTQAWIDEYSKTYQPPSSRVRQLAHVDPLTLVTSDESDAPIEPNSMQVEALAAIKRVRDEGKRRALVVSATGTGKTILAALDVRAVDPDRVLFVAHREQILDRATKDFRKVLSASTESFGKLAGSTKQADRKYVFATIQTLSQPHILDSLDPEAFDYILIDEVHRAGAASFARVIDHFTPRFLLGMTATPERTDDANIFELFDYNVPYEIRLNSALDLNMLAPFHYYGVADIKWSNGETTDDATPLARLVDHERVDHILAALNTYGQAGVQPRGLMFCARKEEARALSVELNTRHFRGKPLRTVALTGDDSIEERERVVERLEAGELDYVLTVDIFNEGVDIPSVNQVVMLRQTQSSIVFVQQLGRGLRKSAGKEYLVVVDFIGNYANNFLIPIALFGDDSLNKESLRKSLISAEERGVLAGLSSVRFDRVAQELVLKSLATAKLDSLPNLKAAIELVRNRVGRTPLLSDFLRFESVDPIVLATRVGNYPELLAKVKVEELSLSREESLSLSVVTRELLTAKRPHELTLLKLLLEVRSADSELIQREFSRRGIPMALAGVNSAIRSLTLEFNTASEVQSLKVAGPAEVDAAGALRLAPRFASFYETSRSFRESIDDVISTGLELTHDRYVIDRPFTPGRQYSRKDASRLLDWSSNMYSTIYGYRVDATSETCPIFITLHKSDEVSASTAYEDELLDPRTLLWYTKSKRTLDSPDVLPIVKNLIDLHVFAKKDDAEGSDFYYLGRATSADPEQTTMPGPSGKILPVVKMHLNFDQPISTSLFDYFRAAITD